VANLWTEFTALRCYAMVKNGNGCKMLRNSWWLQLSKRQKLTFCRTFDSRPWGRWFESTRPDQL